MTTSLASIETFTTPFDLVEGELVAIVSAHPDDQALHASAIQAVHDAGALAFGITATSGEASTLGDWDFVRRGGRLKENRATWEVLGVPPERQVSLQLPDGGLHLPNNYVRLRFALTTLALRHNITTAITPGELGIDEHEDHRSIHEGTLAAASIVRSRYGRSLSVWGIDHERPDTVLGVDAGKKRAALALNKSQFNITAAEPGSSVPDGWVRQGDYFLSEETAELLKPYGDLLDSHESYRKYI